MSRRSIILVVAAVLLFLAAVFSLFMELVTVKKEYDAYLNGKDHDPSPETENQISDLEDTEQENNETDEPGKEDTD